ncbi:hypothetical protein F2Q69_00019335 [Brassica cretica]|uniref:Uncharacterized protein n=1 Tax=Brassica cretica TaxID=69181 RepID=A0A8S9Q370_BRACR|nr:hypothetical protein F2Q69_00019335 [Brassica cretica]
MAENHEMGSLRSSGDSIEGDRTRAPLGRYVASEFEPRLSHYVATKPTEPWLELGPYVVTELWFELGRYVAAELVLESSDKSPKRIATAVPVPSVGLSLLLRSLNKNVRARGGISLTPRSRSDQPSSDSSEDALLQRKIRPVPCLRDGTAVESAQLLMVAALDSRNIHSGDRLEDPLHKDVVLPLQINHPATLTHISIELKFVRCGWGSLMNNTFPSLSVNLYVVSSRRMWHEIR